MKKIKLVLCSVGLIFAFFLSWGHGVAAQEKKTEYFERNVSDADTIRTEQVQELDGYITALKTNKSRLKSLFTPDYRSEKAFESSKKRLFEAFKSSIGYPIPGETPIDLPVFTLMGEDGIGTYYRAKIPVVKGINCDGIYIVPKGLKARAPLVISMHGGGGSPDVALFMAAATTTTWCAGALNEAIACSPRRTSFRRKDFPTISVIKSTNECASSARA